MHFLANMHFNCDKYAFTPENMNSRGQVPWVANEYAADVVAQNRARITAGPVLVHY